ncbi:MAG: hypothetical protein IPM75_13320 [Candidatus Competibacteraceae bacterium]|nr:hypothetical protein [Candidatus Competibacteraceae bacterium]
MQDDAARWAAGRVGEADSDLPSRRRFIPPAAGGRRLRPPPQSARFRRVGGESILAGVDEYFLLIEQRDRKNAVVSLQFALDCRLHVFMLARRNPKSKPVSAVA